MHHAYIEEAGVFNYHTFIDGQPVEKSRYNRNYCWSETAPTSDQAATVQGSLTDYVCVTPDQSRGFWGVAITYYQDSYQPPPTIENDKVTIEVLP